MRDPKARAAVIEAERKHLSTIKGGLTETEGERKPVTGTDEMERFLAGLDGHFAGKSQKLASGEMVPKFWSLHEAIRAFPGHRGKHLTITPVNVSNFLAGRYYGAQVDTNTHPEAIGETGPFVMRAGKFIPMTAAITDSTFGEIYADRAHKSFMQAYSGVSNWEQLVSLASDDDFVSDFKTYRKIRLGGYANIPSVAEGATYGQATTPADVEETGNLTKYGTTETVSLEALADPDGQMLSQIPMKLGEAMGATVRESILDSFTTDDPTMNDSNALYTSHNNNGTTALSGAQLSVIRAAMRSQTEAGSSRVIGRRNDPKYLFVPLELLDLAESIAMGKAPDLYPTTDSALLNPSIWAGKLEVISLDHHTDANNYYLMADPNLMPTFALLRLAGVPNVEFFQQGFADETADSRFDSDTSKWKVRFFWGTIVLDWRGFHENIVA